MSGNNGNLHSPPPLPEISRETFERVRPNYQGEDIDRLRNPDFVRILGLMSIFEQREKITSDATIALVGAQHWVYGKLEQLLKDRQEDSKDKNKLKIYDRLTVAGITAIILEIIHWAATHLPQ